MNAYGLRIQASENKNSASGISFQPVVIPHGHGFENHEACKAFMISSAEEQVSIVQKMLSNIKKSHDESIVTFLVVTYLVAENKHPVKCIIMRFVTKNSFIQDSFAESLTKELSLLIKETRTDYKGHAKVIPKILCCIENFPVGAVAVKNVENELATYLKDCLGCCMTTLSNDKLPPTGRNEVFSLSHTVLRLLLYVIQKIDKSSIDMDLVFKTVRTHLKQLLFSDSPMDTKSVCGILFVTMYVMENGENAWVDILDRNTQDTNLQDCLSNDVSKLSLLSAIATVVSFDKLHAIGSGGVPAVIKLTDNILELGDRYSSESTFTLGISRTMVQISRGLAGRGASALCLLDRLLLFVWSHLEHGTDSVQHLSARILTHVIKFCAHLKTRGDDLAMSKLFSTLSSLERTRKSFYLSLTALAGELGSECVLSVWPSVIEETVHVLRVQAVQASATTSLETLLRHTDADTLGLHAQWVEPVVRCVCEGAGAVGVMTGLLVDIVRKDWGVVDYILPYITQSSTSTDPHQLVCALMLLRVVKTVGRGTGRDMISFELLRRTAVHSDEEIRILSLSLIVESPKSTEAFSSQELDLVVRFVTYNINAQSPHFRQLVLSLMKKFFKRLGQSHRTITREKTADEGDHYSDFVRTLTELCVESLMPGGNHNRRHVALRLLMWIGRLDFADRSGESLVTPNGSGEPGSDRVSRLLDLLGDSYETNRDAALQLLDECPAEVLYSDKYAAALNLESVIEQASSIKPTECVTAAYKMRLLTTKLPRYIDAAGTTTSEVALALLRTLLERVERQVAVCSADLALGARRAPLYGLLHCVARTLEHVDPADWARRGDACAELLATCEAVCACTAPVLHSAAPEGHMPHTDGGTTRFEDGSEVTAQMVLLCAWRSVKEVSLIFSGVVSLLSRSGRAGRVPLMRSIGERFLRLLSDVKHRGAFEQIYVGFSRTLAW